MIPFRLMAGHRSLTPGMEVRVFQRKLYTGREAPKAYTTGLLDISARLCYNAINIRQGQPETGCCAEILFERSCRS